MNSFVFRWLWPAGLLLAAPFAQAQTNQAVSATSPALQYHSVLAQYRRFSDQPVIFWRGANDTVGKIGGWRVYAKEARQPDAPSGNAIPGAIEQSTQPDSSQSTLGLHMGHGGKP